ncbi:hypothetical protein GGI24_000348 [Coemansia furcata]|nr:hypothetical protein GGI24_000348 [Coemansia furcata]
MPTIETVARTASDSADTQALSKKLLNMEVPGRLGVEREFTWDEIKQIVAAERLELLSRTTEQERVYTEHMQLLSQEHGSASAYVLKIKLASFIADDSREYLIIPNDYPYALEPDMSHFIVWSKPKLASGIVPAPVIKHMIGSYLDEHIGESKYEWTWFVNQPHLQSIPDVSHGHLIVKTL